MNKGPKSFQTVIITILVGMFIPKIIEIIGVAFVDKIIIKGILSLSFSIATICVGWLFSVHILSDKVSGGKTRIVLYIVIAIILLSIVSTIVLFIQSVSNVVLYILIGITIVLIAVMTLYLIIKAYTAKRDFKITQEKSIIESSKDKQEEKRLAVQPELKSLYELWEERDLSQKCLTATNDQNPNLKWVKIYKPPYANGRFYGFVLMNHARNTVNGEIYFADRKIWRRL